MHLQSSRVIVMKLVLLVLAVIFYLVDSCEGGTMRKKRSDDTNTAALEVAVQQQAVQIQHQAAQIRQLEELNQQQAAQIQEHQTKLTALENWRSALSTPVAFTVHFSADDGDNGIALGPQQTLKFDTAVTNVGGGYNVQTGIFTAPVSGVYNFFLTIMSPNAHGSLNVALVRDGTILDLVYAEGQGDLNDQGSTQVSTHLQAGQQVWVRQNYGDAVRGSCWTVFTGYKVQAD